MNDQEFILRVTCPDSLGLVAKVSNFLNEQNLFIKDSAHYGDPITKKFFMRVKVISPNQEINKENFNKTFSVLAEEASMDWSFQNAILKPSTTIFVSKYSHCLQDLLYRTSVDSLKINIKSVISNHPDLEKIVSDYGIPFHHIEVAKDNKSEVEMKMTKIIEDDNVDLIILARYMQILTEDLSNKWFGKCINIHHSFLPSFKGANPYEQAFSKGVKLIGATAHFVTPDLDEGPIIEQNIERISHYDNIDDLIRKGNDIESIVLARAVRWHAEKRVLINGNKTVVFT